MGKKTAENARKKERERERERGKERENAKESALKISGFFLEFGE